ncbi:MAG: hypothetical protein WCP35_15340 [Verrucomicrobiota bacterium]
MLIHNEIPTHTQLTHPMALPIIHLILASGVLYLMYAASQLPI